MNRPLIAAPAVSTAAALILNGCVSAPLITAQPRATTPAPWVGSIDGNACPFLFEDVAA